MFIYNYNVAYYNEDDRICRRARGMVAAEEWKEVVTKLTDYYGEDNIYELQATIIDNTEEGIYETSNTEVDDHE